MRHATRYVAFDAAPNDPHDPSATPIHQTATFRQSSATGFDEFDYSRTDNPTRRVLEGQLARMENGAGALAYASGMAAVSALARLVGPGERIMAGNDLYGGTNRLLQQLIGPLGIDVRFVDMTDLEAVASAMDERTRLVLVETPTNPLQRIVDLRGLASITREVPRCIFAVDNTMLSPHLQQPLALGADVVIQSATKWLSGHGDVTAGALVFNDESLHDEIAFIRNAEGNALGPFDSYLLLRGVKTLGLRVDRQEANARVVADWLVAHPNVQCVHYAGLAAHPGYDLHRSQARGAGAVVSLETGSLERSTQLVESLRRFSISVSFGSVHSTASLPCSMSHASIPESERQSRGLPEDLIRLSIGIEDVDDLLDDLERALHSAGLRNAEAKDDAGTGALDSPARADLSEIAVVAGASHQTEASAPASASASSRRGSRKRD